MANKNKTIREKYSPRANVVLYQGNCLDLLQTIPDCSIQLVVTSPPYNIGKEYEKKLKLDRYIEQQTKIIRVPST